AAARGRAPADVAKLVARHVFAQTLKLTPDTAKVRAPLLQFDLAAAHQIHHVLLCLLNVGKYRDGLLEVRYRPAFRQSRRALDLQVDVADLHFATPRRLDPVLPRCLRV